MQYICEKTKMSILVVGTVAFDAIETKHGKTDKIVGGAATYICHSAAPFSNNIKSSVCCWWRLSKARNFKARKKRVLTHSGFKLKRKKKLSFGQESTMMT